MCVYSWMRSCLVNTVHTGAQLRRTPSRFLSDPDPSTNTSSKRRRKLMAIILRDQAVVSGNRHRICEFSRCRLLCNKPPQMNFIVVLLRWTHSLVLKKISDIPSYQIMRQFLLRLHLPSPDTCTVETLCKRADETHPVRPQNEKRDYCFAGCRVVNVTF